MKGTQGTPLSRFFTVNDSSGFFLENDGYCLMFCYLRAADLCSRICT